MYAFAAVILFVSSTLYTAAASSVAHLVSLSDVRAVHVLHCGDTWWCITLLLYKNCLITQALNAAVMAPEQACAAAQQRVAAAVTELQLQQQQQQQLDATTADTATTTATSSSSNGSRVSSILRLDAALQALTAWSDAAAAAGASSSGSTPQRLSVVPELRQAYAELMSDATSAAGASPYVTVVTVAAAPSAASSAANIASATATAAAAATATTADATVAEAEWSSDAVFSSSSNSDAYATATTTTSTSSTSTNGSNDRDSSEVLVGELVAADSSDGVVDLNADDVQEVEDENVTVHSHNCYTTVTLGVLLTARTKTCSCWLCS
jgi:hypothetical protein